MKKNFTLHYNEAFVDDIIHLNEICDKEFECDGDSLHVKLVIEMLEGGIK